MGGINVTVEEAKHDDYYLAEHDDYYLAEHDDYYLAEPDKYYLAEHDDYYLAEPDDYYLAINAGGTEPRSLPLSVISLGKTFLAALNYYMR